MSSLLLASIFWVSLALVIAQVIGPLYSGLAVTAILILLWVDSWIS